MKPDPETTKQLTEADHLANMTQSEGWQIAWAKLQDYILDLQNINNIDDSTPENAMADMRARKMAATLLFEWMKREVYGRIEQQAATTSQVPAEMQGEYIDRGK